MSKIEVDVVLLSAEIDRVELGAGEVTGFVYSAQIPGGRIFFNTEDRAYATSMLGRWLVVAVKPTEPLPF